MTSTALYFRHIPIARFASVICCCIPAVLRAQTTQPATSLLRELNAETQALYQSVRPGLVRVELPPQRMPQAFNDAELAQKWNSRLTADFREKLRAFQEKQAAGDPLNASISSTQPTLTQPVPAQGSSQTNARPTTLPAVDPLAMMRSPHMLFFPPNQGFGPFGSQQPAEISMAYVNPHVLGVILDDSGHVLVPVYIDRDAAEAHPITVIDQDGRSITTRLIGTDENTCLSVVQLQTPTGHPLHLSGSRPGDGSLVMLLSPGGEIGRLVVWTGGLQDRGLIVGLDGNVQGFLRFGQFLAGGVARPLAEDLVRHGEIRRAILGVQIAEVETIEGRHAVRIDQVFENTPADVAGLRRGDLITAFAGSPVEDIPNFSAAIAETNGKADLQVMRGEQTLQLTVELRQ